MTLTVAGPHNHARPTSTTLWAVSTTNHQSLVDIDRSLDNVSRSLVENRRVWFTSTSKLKLVDKNQKLVSVSHYRVKRYQALAKQVNQASTERQKRHPRVNQSTQMSKGLLFLSRNAVSKVKQTRPWGLCSKREYAFYNLLEKCF